MYIKRLIAGTTAFIMLVSATPIQALATSSYVASNNLVAGNKELMAALDVSAPEDFVGEVRSATGLRQVVASKTISLGASMDLAASGGDDLGEHAWESEDPAIISVNGSGKNATITAEEVGTTNIIHRYRANVSDHWNEEVWEVTSAGIPAKFFVAKLVDKASGDSELNYYPSPGDPLVVNGVTYDYMAGIPGLLTEKGRQKAPNIGNRYSALDQNADLIDEKLIREPNSEILKAMHEKIGLRSDQKFVWYSIVYSTNGYHVDGYVTDIPVKVTYRMNPPENAPDQVYTDPDARTAEAYNILSPQQCKFTAPKGYRFVEWKLSTDNHAYQPGQEVPLMHAVTFTAQWEEAPDLPVNEGGASNYVIMAPPVPADTNAMTQGTAQVKVYRDGQYIGDQSFAVKFAGQSANVAFSAGNAVAGEQIGTDYVLSSVAVMRSEGAPSDTEIEQIDYMGSGNVTKLHDGDILYLLYSSTFVVNGTVEIDGKSVDFDTIRRENSDQNREFIDWLNQRYVMNYGLGTGSAAIVYGGDPTDSRLTAKDTHTPFGTMVDLKKVQSLAEVVAESETYVLGEKTLHVRTADGYQEITPGDEAETIDLDQSDYIRKRSNDLNVIETAMARDFVFDLKIQASPKVEIFALYGSFSDDGARLSAEELEGYAKDGIHIQPGQEQLDLVKGQRHTVEFIAPKGYVITGYQDNITAQVNRLVKDNLGVAQHLYETTGAEGDNAVTDVRVVAFLAEDKNGDLVPDASQIRFTYQSADDSTGSLNGELTEYVIKQGGTARPQVIPQPVAQPGYAFDYWQIDQKSDVTDMDREMSVLKATDYTADTTFVANFAPDKNNDGVPDRRQVFVLYRSADTEQGTVVGTDQTISLSGTTPWTQVETTPAVAQAKDGYLFDRWTVDYGGLTLTNGQQLDAQTLDQVSGGTVITFTAHFRPEIVYRLIFETAYGTVGGGTQFAVDVSERELSPAHTYVPQLPADVVLDTPENMVFMHWSQENPQNKVYDTDDQTIPAVCNVVSFADQTAQTLYAVWASDVNKNGIPDVNEQRYKVTYIWKEQPEQAELPEDTGTYLVDTKVALNDKYGVNTTLYGEKDGVPGIYTFSGWEGITVQNGYFEMPDHDLLLNGSWRFQADTNADGIADDHQIIVRYLCDDLTYGTVEQAEQVFTYTKEEVEAAGHGALPERTLAARAIVHKDGQFSGWSSDGLGKQLWTTAQELNIPVKFTADQLGQVYTITASFTRQSSGGARHPGADNREKNGNLDSEGRKSGGNGSDTTRDDNITQQKASVVETRWLNIKDHYAYIVGYAEDGTVRPNAQITRAEVATIFFRLLTDEARDQFWMTSNTFSDVLPNDWYNVAVSTMVHMGIIRGYEDGTFRPNTHITRAEFAAIAARFMASDYDMDADFFRDIANHWARESINDAAMAGWINGYEDGTFRPEAAITRAEAVTLVNNVLLRKPNADYMLDTMTKWSDNPEGTWYYEAMQEATNSHDYVMCEDGQCEIWTALRENRDWAALEKDWMNAHRTDETL